MINDELSEFMNNFHFIRPEILWLAIIPILFSFIRKSVKDTGIFSSWTKICDQYLLPHLLVKKETSSVHRVFRPFFTAFMITVIALSGPTYKKINMPAIEITNNIAIVADISACMLAHDVDFPSNRTEKLKMKLFDIMKKTRGENVSLIIFGEKPFTVAPLTKDHGIIERYIPLLTPQVMLSVSSNPHRALQSALKSFEKNNVIHGSIILTTCTGNINSIRPTAQKIAKLGHHLYILGTGSYDGAPVPSFETKEFMKKTNGKVFFSKIDIKAYTEMAKTGHGSFALMSNSNSDINKILHDQRKNIQQDINTAKNERILDTWQDMGGVMALFAVPFFAAMFRKGFLVLLMFFLFNTQPARAFEFKSLWFNKNQLAKQYFEDRDYKTAKERFDNPMYAGIAAYKDEDYEKAAKLFKKAYEETEDLNALYNQGNAVAYQRKYEEAIAIYDKVLEQNPQYQNAEDNRDYLKKLLEEQQKQKNNKDQEKQQQNKNNKNDQQQSNGKSCNQDDQQQSGGKSGDQDDQQQSGSKGGDQDDQQQSGGKSGDQDDQQQRNGNKGDDQDDQQQSGGKSGDQDDQQQRNGNKGDDQDDQQQSGGKSGDQDDQQQRNGNKGGDQDDQQQSGGKSGDQDDQQQRNGNKGGDQDDQQQSGGDLKDKLKDFIKRMIDIRDNEKNNQQSQNDNRNNQSGKNNPSKDADDENYNQQSQNDGRNNQSGKNNPSKDTDDENYNQLRNGNKGYHDDEQQNTDHKQDKGEKYVVDPNGDIIVKLLNAPDSDPDDQRLNRIPTDRENFLKRRIMLKNGQQMRYKLTK